MKHPRPGAVKTRLAAAIGPDAAADLYRALAEHVLEAKRCAARGTEMYSGKPAASIVVSDLVDQHGLERPQAARRLDGAGLRAVAMTAERIVDLVDDLMEQKWSRRSGELIQITDDTSVQPVLQEPVEATCSCGSGIPVLMIMVNGEKVAIVALPLIFDQFREAGKQPSDQTAYELLEMVKIYNSIPAETEPAYLAAMQREFAVYSSEKETAG